MGVVLTVKSIYFDLIYKGVDPWKPFTQDTEKLGLRKRCFGQRDDFTIPKKIIETEDVKSEVNTSSFVYGEIKYLPFAKVLKTCRPKKADNFYDLGSGAGKGVFTAALSCNFKKVKGVEYLPSLTKLSNMVLKRYSKKIKPKLSLNKQKQKIEFVNSDILKFDCSDADMIYIASTTFNQPLMDDIAEHIKKVRPGAVILTLTDSLPQRIFRLSGKIKMATSWDSSTTVYIYKRRWKILSKEPKKKVIGEPKTFKKIFQYANENYKNSFYHQALKYYDKALRVKKKPASLFQSRPDPFMSE